MLRNLISSKLELVFGNFSFLHVASITVLILLIIAVSLLAFYLTNYLIRVTVEEPFKKSKALFLKSVIKNKVFKILPHLIFGFMLWAGSQIIIEQGIDYTSYLAKTLEKISLVFIFIAFAFLLSRLIWSLNYYYERKFDFSKQYPIYSYLKVLILLVWVMGLVFLIAFFTNTSFWAILTGVGAVSAVFLLIFKDTLMGIIASVQLTALDMLRIGDVISLDKYNVHGTVLDMSINTVKVRNSYDNTTVLIPTYMLTTDLFKNWRELEEVGIRRIRRPIHVDIDSIKICEESLLNSLLADSGIEIYIKDKISKDITNLNLYRTYMLGYLKHHPLLDSERLMMVRHVELTPTGLALEISAYVKQITAFDSFENVQAGIFEHALVMLPKFDLKVFQRLKSN